jgi:folate-dependent phosphoribosylglycinamide formyltransferase PurN
MAINEFGFLVPSALTADVLRPEVGEVYLVVHHVVLAIFRWDQDQEGVVHMVMRQTDRGRVLKQCVKLLAFLDAKLIQEVEVDVVGRV